MTRHLAKAWHAAILATVLGAVALVCAGVVPSSAFDLQFKIIPATFSPAVARVRAQPAIVDPQPKLTNELLAAYVARQQKLKAFDGFTIDTDSVLTEAVLSSYIARQRNPALDAIESAEVSREPVLNASLLADYARKEFVPTVKLVKQASSEQLCLAQALYHEARGESEAGQWAVANIIINRAMSPKYPSTLCGVVFQGANGTRYRCQFTFACDGRSDMGTERKAWNRAVHMAAAAYKEFKDGKRPGVVPNSALFYHTTNVAPKWSYTFRRVAAIGSHVFYAVN